MLKSVHDWSKRNNRGWEARVRKLSNELNVTEKVNDQYLSTRFAIETVRTNLCIKDINM